MVRWILCVFVCMVFGTPASAQTLGTITGEVKDTTGAALPGATVTAQNIGTNAVRTQQSNDVGAYTFPAMPPGAYLVKAELDGFRIAQNRVELHVEETLRVSLTLEIGGITETTEVTAVTSLITTENATVGTVIENRRIVELPLNGRNYLSLIALSPNVSASFAGPGQAGDRQGGSRANQQISISGQRREFNYYTLDGVDNTDVNFNTYIFLPSVDALEEFKVQTGIYSAEFGRAAGQVNVVTKSGSNAFHGTVFEFHRNDAARFPPVRLHGRPGRRRRNQTSGGTSTAIRPAARSSRTACSSCRTSRATRTTRRSSTTSRCRRWPCGRAISRHSPHRSSIRPPAPSRARAGRAGRSRATAFRPIGSIRSRNRCSSSIRSRTRPAPSTTTSHGIDRVIDRKQYTSAWTSSRARR